jgi:hypothetical protein
MSNNKIKIMEVYSVRIKYLLVGKGYSKKLMPYCNDRDRFQFLTNLKGCLL